MGGGEVIETKPNRNDAMTIKIKEFREALKTEYEERSIVYGCRCSAAAIAVLNKLLAAEPQPRVVTDEEIQVKGKELNFRRTPQRQDEVDLARWAIEQSRPAVCGPTAEEVWEWARECMCGVDKNLNAKSFRDWYDSRVLPTAELKPRGLTVDDIVEQAEYHGFTDDRIAGLACWIVKQSRPAVCGPTAEEVFDKIVDICDLQWTDHEHQLFVEWHTSHVQPVADVTALLEKRIAELEDLVEEYGNIDALLAASKKELTKAKERIAELEEDNKRLKSSWKCQAGALQQVNAELESQLDAAKAEYERQHNDVISIVQSSCGVSCWCNKADVIKKICGNGSGRCKHKIESMADKPLDWKNMAVNERLEAVGCRSVNDSDLMLTLHDDSTFSIEPRTKPPCMTVEDMREVVADSEKHEITSRNIRLGTEGMECSYHRGIQDTIRALAGHVADQTAEVTRLRQEASRCIQAACVGNDTNRYESVAEMLADLIRKHCDERGQEIHKLCGFVGDRNQTIRELRAELKRMKDMWQAEGHEALCQNARANHLQKELDKIEPKAEWPQWFEWILHNVPYRKWIRLDSTSGRAAYRQDGSPVSTSEEHWTVGIVLRDRNAWHPIPHEPDAVRKWRKENEWPKYVVTNGIKSIEELRRLDGPEEEAVSFNADGIERGTYRRTGYYLSEQEKKSFPAIPTAEAEAMIAEAKERAKPTERWYTSEYQGCLWVYRDDGTSEVWYEFGEHRTPACHLESNPIHIRISKDEADAIRAGWKKEEGK